MGDGCFSVSGPAATAQRDAIIMPSTAKIVCARYRLSARFSNRTNPHSPVSAPNPKTNTTGSADHCPCTSALTCETTGRYSPNAIRSDEPEIPGSTIAEAAAAAAINRIRPFASVILEMLSSTLLLMLNRVIR